MGFLRLIRRVPSKICRAAREGDVLLLRSILKKHPQAANFICDEGWSPLMLGAGIRDHDSASSTCKLLLDAGADVHYQNAHGISALHVAAKWGHYILTALILLKGANPNISTSGGVTPLHLAAGTLYSDLGRSECCTTVMELLLDNGAEIDTVDFSGNTALHYAVEIGHTEIVRLLTSKGAEVDTVGHSGNTVLHYAVERGHTEIVRLLMSNGADPLIRNIKDYTPLYLSVVAGECDTTKVLIDCGAEVNPSCRKEGNQRPLHVVAKTSNVEIAKLLLASNADINAIDDSGYTPLQYAFENDPWVDDVDSEHSMVGLLKRHGAKLGDVSEDLFEAVESSNLKNT
ncbi:MAG: ankyrin repeat domain-containing protein, partial [Proteobacteria bacterium]|nr:ankyrin repeat domain-containing protein [Pseudomonadota bacterium]